MPAATSTGPIVAAIARHRAAYDAYQVAPEGAASIEANDEYDEASLVLVTTGCATRFGAWCAGAPALVARR